MEVEGDDASKVTCYGPGLEPGKIKAGQPVHFTVDASKSETPLSGEKCPLKVNIRNDKGENSGKVFWIQRLFLSVDDNTLAFNSLFVSIQ